MFLRGILASKCSALIRFPSFWAASSGFRCFGVVGFSDGFWVEAGAGYGLWAWASRLQFQGGPVFRLELLGLRLLGAGFPFPLNPEA